MNTSDLYCRNCGSTLVLDERGARCLSCRANRDPFATFEEALRYYESKDERSVAEKQSTNTIETCYKLREAGYRPYAVAKIYGFDVEFISYPFPDIRGVSIMVRQPNDPTTLRHHVIQPNVLAAALVL